MKAAASTERHRKAEKLMSEFTSLVKCDNMNDLFEYTMCVSATMESVDRKAERGSDSGRSKAQSLLGRWFNKADKPVVSGEGEDSEKDVWYYLERDTMVTSRIKMGTGKDSLMKVVHLVCLACTTSCTINGG